MTVASAASKMVAKSNEGPRRGPSNKNLNSRRRSEASPVGQVMSKTRPIKGPDKGAG
jgi:hypothetical protein